MPSIFFLQVQRKQRNTCRPTGCFQDTANKYEFNVQTTKIINIFIFKMVKNIHTHNIEF